MNLEYRLSDRKRDILTAIIKDYITHGEPLGSKTLAKRHGFSFSPATIRNEMAELEETGLLYQPHTSAGRVPSQKGYRFFVDYLMSAYVPTQAEMQFIKRLQQTSRAVEAVLSQATRVLAEATQSIAITETPYLRQNPVKELRLIPLGDHSMVLDLEYNSGIRRQSVVNFSQSIYADVLELLTYYLNAQLNQSTSLVGLFHQIATCSLEREIQAYRSIILEMVSEIYAQSQRDEKVYLNGTSHLLREPEFQSMEQAFPILNILEDERFVRQLFDSCQESRPRQAHNVYCLIGDENAYEELHNCSFVAMPYFINTKATGMIGVLGPTRMDYSKVIALLQNVASNMTMTLGRLFS